jgi:hypothetical protein
MRIDEFGTAGSLYFDIGGIVELIPKLSFGAYISTFTLSKLSNSEKTNMPVIMKVGISYKPTNELSLNMDIFKDIDYEPLLNWGWSIGLLKKFF